VLRTVENCDQLDAALDVLIELHQKRRQMLGEPGCFASPRFTAFHREVSRRLLTAGHLQLQLLELDGQPLAAEYQIAGQGVTYIYQAGIEPRRLADEPGHLITMATVKRAIEQGGRAVDFLRGDEPYKAHFRALARPLLALRVVPKRTVPRLRNNLWLAGRKVKHWLNQSSAGSQSSPIAQADSCAEIGEDSQQHPRATTQVSGS
jgi:CelD/BcsL family acetyltransferase involved in cellulose biosynthesis